ncbi:MAG: ADP-glyceromanno-heptose 6-epimerase [Planctomycetes bacterium]|nr:ADP-glyceromanno-heptose 6-epimerase [Planctomycetota bacterium]MCP4770198.1 ADP-glyceromanno-heptose 6-epimerase [Planctomycetota bacterium]MCP4860654.1 ADP-glyceromanno-heptose 6-epimerase [Planctomycetota bacterium]
MIVVTGGAGFIGSNLLAALEGRGDLVVVDHLGQGDMWRNIAKRELADVIRPQDLQKWLAGRSAEQIQAIFHMGAISSTTETDVDVIVENNIRLTLDLFRWCASEKVRFIYASSAATYGDGSEGFDDDDSVAALAKLQPLNAYGWSKQVIDRRLARVLREGGSLPPQCVGLKFFNVYGPNEYHKGSMRSVVHQLHPKVAAGEAAKLFRSHHPDYQDGGQLRDFIYVKDVVDVMLWLFENPEVQGLYNVGTGQARSFADLAGAVFGALGKEPRFEFVDTPIEIRDKYQYFTQASMQKLRAAGYDRAFTSLEDGVKDYVLEYLEQADPWL